MAKTVYIVMESKDDYRDVPVETWTSESVARNRATVLSKETNNSYTIQELELNEKC